MWTLISAELSYHRKNLFLLIGVAILGATFPYLLGVLGVNSSVGHVSLSTSLPVIAVTAYFWLHGFMLLGAWGILMNERTEGRIVLYARLPLDPWALAAARLLRAVILTILWAFGGFAALLISSIIQGFVGIEPFILLMVLAIASSLSLAIISLLLDIGGPRLVQLAAGTIAAAGITLLIVAPEVASTIGAILSVFASTPLGIITLIAIVVGLLALNLALQVSRGPTL